MSRVGRDYHSLIARAVEGLHGSTRDYRLALYQRARTAQLKSFDPEISEAEFRRQPIERNDFFPGQLVGGTSAHGFNIDRLGVPQTSAFRKTAIGRNLKRGPSTKIIVGAARKLQTQHPKRAFIISGVTGSLLCCVHFQESAFRFRVKRHRRRLRHHARSSTQLGYAAK